MLPYNINITNKGFLDLNPLICGYADTGATFQVGPVMRDYCMFHYILEGEGNLYTNGKTHHIRAGECFMFPSHQVVSYAPDEKNPWSYIWIGFNGELSKRFEEIQHPILQLPKYLFTEMLACENLENMREEHLTSKLFLLYAAVFANDVKKRDYVQEIVNFIEINYMTDIKISDLCSMVGVDRSYLSRIFKKRMGMSMQQYLIQVRLSRSVQLLREGYRVAEASNIVGYEDVFNFSKIFKKWYHISPREYKKKYAGKTPGKKR